MQDPRRVGRGWVHIHLFRVVQRRRRMDGGGGPPGQSGIHNTEFYYYCCATVDVVPAAYPPPQARTLNREARRVPCICSNLLRVFDVLSHSTVGWSTADDVVRTGGAVSSTRRLPSKLHGIVIVIVEWLTDGFADQDVQSGYVHSTLVQHTTTRGTTSDKLGETEIRIHRMEMPLLWAPDLHPLTKNVHVG